MMNWKKVWIYLLSFLLILYQVGMCVPIKVSASHMDMKNLLWSQEYSVYRAEKQYKKWMKDYPKCIQGIKEWRKINGKYSYPVTPYDKEWKNYIMSIERYVVCQIPQKILEELTTEELFELVLDCPMVTDICLYNSIEEGVKILAQNFNGMNELLSRLDCLEIITKYYESYNIPTKQQLDYDVLLGDTNHPDYNVIVKNENRMRKADKDAKVMNTLNICEAIFEIATDENILSQQEEEVLTKIVLQKNKEKMGSECVEGASTEIDQEDSILNRYLTKFSITSASSNKKGAAKSSGTFFQLSDNSKVYYTISNNKEAIANSTISQFLKRYEGIKLTNGEDAVTVAGGGGTKAYDCYNFAWLKKYDPANLWKKCVLGRDEPYRKYKYFKSASSPSGSGWVGSGRSHAVYVVKKEVSYRDNHGNVKFSPLVKSKWGQEGPLLQHPLTLSNYTNITQTSDLVWYC